MPKDKYDFLVADAVLSPGELELARRQAHKKRIDIEQVLIEEFQVKIPAIGQALAKFFGVPYEPYKSDRIKPIDLLKNLKREYAEANQWLPIDDTKEGVVVLCLDPERTRTSQIVPYVFPKSRIIYKVTTQKEFKDTLNQFYGGETDDDDIYELPSEPGPQDETAQLYGERARLLQETVDLWLCSLALLRRYGLALPDVLAELRRREGASDSGETADR